MIFADIKPFSYVSLTLVVLYAAYVLLRKPVCIFRYFAFWFAVYANIIGCAINEFANIYLTELVCNTYYAGSLPLLACLLYTSYLPWIVL